MDLACYSDLEIGFPYCFKNSFAIQHGISWDNPNEKLKMKLMSKQYLLAVENYKKIICVYTNFINWLRGHSQKYFKNPDKCKYIPNFADENKFVYKYNEWTSKKFPLLYPRRLVAHRGYDIFTEMCLALIKQKYNIIPIYAFEDYADEKKIKQAFNGIGECIITHPNFDEMTKLYYEAFLSYIPTKWSEGTSLSAIESISCGCPVISSDVGGLGNIIIPNMNGDIISPCKDDFIEATKKVLDNPEIRNQWSKNCRVFNDVLGIKRWRREIKNAIGMLL